VRARAKRLAVVASALAAGALAAAVLAASTLATSACGSSTDGGVLDACADLDATCFSNADCTDPTTHCTVPTNADPTLPITCCLSGARGTAEAGVPCTALDDCQTAICAYTPSGTFYCSGPCSADSQCPMELPSCVTIDAGSFCGLPP
jgi:hypothetical protein